MGNTYIDPDLKTSWLMVSSEQVNKKDFLQSKMDVIRNSIKDMNQVLKGIDSTDKLYKVTKSSTKSWKKIKDVLDLYLSRLPEGYKNLEDSMNLWLGFIHSTMQAIKCCNLIPVVYQIVLLRALENRLTPICDEMKTLMIDQCAKKGDR